MIIQIFEAHLYNEPTPLVSVVRDCPQDLSELVLHLLAKKPEARVPRARAAAPRVRVLVE
jgi:hypothetical protein